jgi:autotransporter passenger strand-loop-strand repeat protein
MPTSVTVNSANSPYHVTNGQADTSDTVVSGGQMLVDSGGTASATTVSGGGNINVSSGGSTVSGTLVGSGVTALAIEDLLGGTDTGTTVSSGGSLVVTQGCSFPAGAPHPAQRSSAAATRPFSPAASRRAPPSPMLGRSRSQPAAWP